MERKMIKSKRVLHNFDAYFFQKYLIHLQIPISLLDFTIELLSKNLIMKQEKLMTKKNLIKKSDNKVEKF